jgi:hypothetical protein
MAIPQIWLSGVGAAAIPSTPLQTMPLLREFASLPSRSLPHGLAVEALNACCCDLNAEAQRRLRTLKWRHAGRNGRDCRMLASTP